MTFAFTVFGVPQPGGSKRAIPRKLPNGKLAAAVMDANPKSRDWKEQVASAAREKYDGELLRGPLSVSFHFFRPRPKSHFHTSKKQLGELRADAQSARPTTKPDVLKLARAVEDALTGVLWADDAQIVEEALRKDYGEPARVVIVVSELAERTTP